MDGGNTVIIFVHNSNARRDTFLRDVATPKFEILIRPSEIFDMDSSDKSNDFRS